MLDDRKFYHPVLAQEPEAKPRRFGRPPPRRWTSVGSPEAVVMDASHPFVGQRSPRVTLDPAEPRGVRQAGLALVEGKAYVGRVVLAGATGGPVQVSLVWGQGARERQGVDVGPLTAAWATFPLELTAGAGSDDGRLEITARVTARFGLAPCRSCPRTTSRGSGRRPSRP